MSHPRPIPLLLLSGPLLLLSGLLSGCNGPEDSKEPTPAPFGMPLVQDGQLYAGVARVILTPELTETFQDLNGNHVFDGCVNEPDGAASGRPGCDEPFNDADGDGNFDAIWIAGFQSKRAALEVHDDMTLTALVLALDGEYVALAGIDGIGVLESRVREGRELLGAEGFDADRVILSASHSHQSPDTVGIWGDQDNLASGVNPDYNATIGPALFDAVSLAAQDMVAVSPRYGSAALSDDPDLTGEPFGGINPDPRMIGTIRDIRDPLIAGDQLFALGLDDASGARLATLMNFSSHPEVVGDENNALSGDYVHYAREWVEGHGGGTAIFLSGALGGMQSGLGGTMPLLDDAGDRVINGDDGQVWISESGWELARTQGYLVGQRVEGAMTDTTPWDHISVTSAPLPIPVTNIFYELAFRLDLLDTKAEDLVQDASCPGYGTNPDVFGCVPASVWMVQLGPITLGTVPGELFPELFWGVPEEAAMADAALRAGDRRWLQQDPDCVGVDFEECRIAEAVGDCDCLSYHTAPYRLSDDPEIGSLSSMLPGTYKVPVGIANGYCGYIVPGPDFNTYVSALTEQGDHYEETNSCTPEFAPLIQEAYRGMVGL